MAAAMITACSPQPESVTSAVDAVPAVSDSAVVSASEPEREYGPMKENIAIPENSPVGYYGELLVDGSAIVAENTGRPTQVTGMSFFWSNWSDDFYTADYVDMMVEEYGCEVVRASYGINGSQPYSPSDEQLIRVVVEAAIEKGVYVIIDWHAHDAHLDADEAAEFFSAMAEDYGRYDNVIFEPYNEPTQVAWEDVKEYAQVVVDAIREHSDNLIIVGSPTWSQDVHRAAADPLEDGNTAYTLHFYAGTHKGWLRDRAEEAMEDGIALFVTEWGSCSADGNGDIDRKSTLEWINWCNEHGISMCNWAVNDKRETSSVFNSDDTLTETGEFVLGLIGRRTAQSEWLTGQPYSFTELTEN